MTDCIKELREFFETDEHFKNIPTWEEKLEKFKMFDISDIDENSIYSKCSSSYDQDDTYIARLVMYAIWKNELPELTNFDDIGTNKKYRGETINTFNTLFRQDCCGIDKFLDNTPEDNKLKTIIKEFKKEYTTIGNFMLFPTDTDNNGKNINLLKMSLSNDFADLYFMSIWKDGLYEYVSNMGNINKKYFEKFKDYEYFCKVNFLTEYENNGKPKIVFDHATDDKTGKYYTPYYWWTNWRSEDWKKSYKDFAKNYIKQSRVIIKNRAEKICNKLLPLLRDK